MRVIVSLFFLGFLYIRIKYHKRIIKQLNNENKTEEVKKLIAFHTRRHLI